MRFAWRHDGFCTTGRSQYHHKAFWQIAIALNPIYGIHFIYIIYTFIHIYIFNPSRFSVNVNGCILRPKTNDLSAAHRFYFLQHFKGTHTPHTHTLFCCFSPFYRLKKWNVFLSIQIWTVHCAMKHEFLKNTNERKQISVLLCIFG